MPFRQLHLSQIQIPLHDHMIVLHWLPPLDLVQDLLGGNHPHAFPIPGPGWVEQHHEEYQRQSQLYLSHLKMKRR